MAPLCQLVLISTRKFEHTSVLVAHVQPFLLQESVLAAELVLATLLETARVGDAGPATVARNAAGRLDTPGAGHVPGDTPWPRREPGAHLGWKCLTEVFISPLDLLHDIKQEQCTPLAGIILLANLRCSLRTRRSKARTHSCSPLQVLHCS